MRGFCETGILLFPKMETYEFRGEDYHAYLKKGADKVIQFFKNRNILLDCFTTNEVALIIAPEGVNWVNSSTPEDIFFIKRNCDGMSNIKEGSNLDKFYEEARKKYVLERGLPLEKRFEVALKRDKFVANKQIKSYKLVVTFEHQNNPYYKTESKPNDGRIILKINHSNFVGQAYMSGNAIDIVQILQYNGAARPVHLWEV